MNLITGGAGFLGSHLVELLAKLREPVRVFDLPSASTSHLPTAGVEFCLGDIRDRAAVKQAVLGCRRVFHLAGNPQLWTKRRRDFDEINHQGAENVLTAAADAGAARIVFASTESILSRAGSASCNEMVEPRMEEMIGEYCRSKLRGEQAAFRLARRGAPIVVASPTLPVGPGDRSLTPPTRMTVSFLRGKLPAYMDCRFNMIDARDVAKGFWQAAERGRPGQRYLLGAENIRLIDWLSLVGAVVGRKPPKFQVPYPLALTAAFVSETIANWITHRSPNATWTGVRLSRRSMHFDTRYSLTELDLHPRPLEQSARDAVAWYQQMGWI